MTLNFCPECTAKLQKKSDTSYVCVNGHPFWNNAKTAVAIAFCKDKTLLVSQRGVVGDPNYGKYDLPGGFVDFGEDAYQAAIREVAEELGIQVTPRDLHLAAVYQMNYDATTSTVDIIFVVTNWQGTPKKSDESLQLAWRPYDFIYDSDFCEAYDGLDELLPVNTIATIEGINL